MICVIHVTYELLPSRETSLGVSGTYSDTKLLILFIMRCLRDPEVNIGYKVLVIIEHVCHDFSKICRLFDLYFGVCNELKFK